MTKPNNVVVSLMLGLAILAACGSAGSESTGSTPAQGAAPAAGATSAGMIERFDLGGFGGGSNPQVHYNPFSPNALSMVYSSEPLFAFNSYAGEKEPWLTTAYAWKDPQTLTFMMRDGVKQKATQILEQAGYKKDANGKLIGKDGRPIEFNFLAQNGWADWIQAARTIQENLNVLGMVVNVQTPSAALLPWHSSVQAAATQLTVPNNRAAAFGTGPTLSPFGQPTGQSERYQQVYAAAQFAATPGPQRITQLAFRPRSNAVSKTPYTSTIANIRIDLATTKLTPDTDVSPIYARNLGTNTTTVYNGPLTIAGNFTGVLGSADDFDVVINLQTPFIYEPSQGNLLLDVRNVSGGSVQTYFDMQRVSGVDSVSRVAGSTGGAAAVNNTSGTLDAGGLITRFSLTPEPSSNWAPYVSAGADQVITLPAMANLTGAVTDDGRPSPPATTTARWSKVSGPGTATFANSGAAVTTVGFSQAGTYLLRLTANDGARTTYDDTTIIVNRANAAPAVTAGDDQHATFPNDVRLNGVVTDDGLPNPPSAVTLSWSKVSGPGTATFANSAAAVTTVGFSQAGTYLLRLTANDGGRTTSDDVAITITAPSSTNQAPSVNAGVDQSVLLGTSVALNGMVSDDGLPNPPNRTSVLWSMLSGPAPVTFTNPTATSTTASFAVAGSYVLRVTATDSSVPAADDVGVAVRPMTRVVVPNTYATSLPNGGKNGNSDPLGLTTGQQSHYQQVYSASQFGAITGPQTITQIAFRPSYVYGTSFTTQLSKVQVELSTTSAAPDSDLSTNMVANVGVADRSVVYSGALTLSSANSGPVGGPKSFDIVIVLQRPFVYDPRKGNLLLDVRNYGGANVSPIYYEGVYTSGDGVSRMYASSTSSDAGSGDTLGLVTQWTFAAAP